MQRLVGSLLVEALARGSVIHLAALASAPLPPLSDLLEPPALNPAPTLAAGLPHFSTGNFNQSISQSINTILELYSSRFNKNIKIIRLHDTTAARF